MDGAVNNSLSNDATTHAVASLKIRPK
ncbi:hypothetical protein BIW11_03499 [Tropilaelaps mercedesae]|uniref:Uncharacterized protein n=1 Tax=Tropilaelaps mercedesae TaxID=418985 RepID=A0A1V9XK32_9ACAR|nr:hypothetical protein BIW11_03499 [Tropilaelaps mercedesae]